MSASDDARSPCPAAIYVDMGTTNTRGWLVHDRRVVASHRVGAGARDTARTGSRAAVEESMRALCGELESAARRMLVKPTAVVGTGMIGSPQGLAEVPHLHVPVGLPQLAAGAVRVDVPAVTQLPVVLVPGVRTSPTGDKALVEDADVMRGEETLCLGLLQQGRIGAGSCLLNLGSHWKLIGVDAQTRIAWSETTLSGELVQAAWRETILASALPEERPAELEPRWIVRGRIAMRERGVARALFCVRLFEQQAGSSSTDRLAFLYGVFLESDLSSWLRRGRLKAPVAIVGVGALAHAWADALMENRVRPDVVTQAESESAVIAGLDAVLAAAAPRLGLWSTASE